jgi:hypothetical protein
MLRLLYGAYRFARDFFVPGKGYGMFPMWRPGP